MKTADDVAAQNRTAAGLSRPPCRLCQNPLEEIFVDLGMSPLSNAYIQPARAMQMEPYYPLRVYACGVCFLVQLQEFETPEAIFAEDYAYFSSYSTTWLRHVEEYAGKMIRRFNLTGDSLVIEAASNDGYLLQYFRQGGIPVLGIEPARNVAEVAEGKGIPTRSIFFGADTATQLVAEGIRADVFAGNNVYAHVPDLHSFTEGMRIVLKPQGVITLEFPHLLQLIHHNQFDTIYHEHFSYLSLLAVEYVFARHGLQVFDVEELPTHGGSLRIYGKHAADESRVVSEQVQAVRQLEADAGLNRLETYRAFGVRVCDLKCDLLQFLIDRRRQGKTVAGYGAPAKGNTLLNYCGVGPELLSYTVDRSPHKQGRLLPGSRIPIHAPEMILETRPDYVLILPWNLRDEIAAQMAEIRSWGGRFVTPIPSLQVF
jgi:hypothetical protein